MPVALHTENLEQAGSDDGNSTEVTWANGTGPVAANSCCFFSLVFQLFFFPMQEQLRRGAKEEWAR